MTGFIFGLIVGCIFGTILMAACAAAGRDNQCRECRDSLVRCKDCRWHDDCICVVCEEGNTVVCMKQHKHVPKNHYCSFGEQA